MMHPALLSLAFDAAPEGGAAGQLLARSLTTYQDFCAASSLYVSVFGYESPEFSLNPNLLGALVQNGGSAVGVFAPDGALVGFAYGFPGKGPDGREFHYSQAATVDPNYQGRGIGRTLKFLQAEVARSWGHRTMRWTFDPLLARNAHFNFDALGATGIGYLPDYYGRSDTGRVLVEWSLEGEAPQPRPELTAPTFDVADWGTALAERDELWIATPAVPPADTDERRAVRSAVGRVLSEAILSGHSLVACKRINDETAAYLALSSTERSKDDS